MIEDIKLDILKYIQIYQHNPLKIITFVVDISIVLFLTYHLLKIVKDSRAWQLVKGITLLVIATWLSRFVKFKYTKLYFICCYELGSNSFNYNLST